VTARAAAAAPPPLPAPPPAAVAAPITGVEVRRYAVALDPPFHAAWDPVPRATAAATLVIVHSEDGVAGYASGDDVPDAALLERLLVGVDPMRTEVVREIFETVDFHGGRPWTVEVAIWDLVGRLVGQPLWRLLGGRSERLLAYASTAEPVAGDERARRVAALRDAGVRAVKLRFHHADWRRDVEVVEEVRDAVGRDVEIMVDANQGWRMAGDRSARWDVATATQCALALEPLGIYWLEEPLRTDDVEGYALLRRRTSLRIAAGEMVRSLFEARDLILRGGVDVVQPDVVLAGGLGGCRRIAALADLCGRAFSPHTWTNGFGLVANLHLAAAVSTCPYLEVPLDPPGWTPARRDWLLGGPAVEIAADGTIAPPPGPGLGVVPDLDRLEAHRIG
jgi:D-galactarolactone cycloisomerase